MDASSVESPPAAPTREEIVAALKAQQNLALAIPAGLAAALAGAALWGAVVYATDAEVGLIAVAVGALVGYAVRWAGKGIDPVFGWLGAACAALGWALGTVMSDIAFLAHAKDADILDVLRALDAERLAGLVQAVFSPMDLLFLAIAVYEGYKLSFRGRLKPAVTA